MNKLKSPLNSGELTAVILCTVTGAVVFGFFCYLSFNFLSLGKTQSSILWATLIAVFLCIPVVTAICLKKTKPTRGRIIGEWVLLFSFAVAAIFAIFPFSHFFAVSEQKSEIQQTVTANITQAENLFTDYENYANNRLNIYENKLKSIVAGKRINPTEYSNYGFVSGTNDNTQIENNMFILKAQLYPSNYEEMKQIDTDWLASSKATVRDWKPIGIVTVINEVKSNLTSWKNQLTEFSAFRARGEIANDFDYALTFDDATDKFETFGSPTSLSVLYAVCLFILIFLPYIPIKRHSKSKFSNYKTLFCSRKATSSSGGTIRFD
jgi:hypothetical protein